MASGIVNLYCDYHYFHTNCVIGYDWLCIGREMKNPMPIRKEKPWQENASRKVVGSNPSAEKGISLASDKVVKLSCSEIRALFNCESYNELIITLE